MNSPKDHCTIVTFNKNAIRGNHFHKKSTQYSFILNGKLKMITAKVDKKGRITSKIKKNCFRKYINRAQAFICSCF